MWSVPLFLRVRTQLFCRVNEPSVFAVRIAHRAYESKAR